ncbi:hypothetical protein LX36DRAFT_369052 [Colletotrichum falcatum]|nr:hypothetical protein LX36DRAFT_369052 [Colletotrichum falcatum]
MRSKGVSATPLDATCSILLITHVLLLRLLRVLSSCWEFDRDSPDLSLLSSAGISEPRPGVRSSEPVVYLTYKSEAGPCLQTRVPAPMEGGGQFACFIIAHGL